MHLPQPYQQLLHSIYNNPFVLLQAQIWQLHINI